MAHRFRVQPAKNTTAAGYGHAHQQERKRRLTFIHPGDPCGYCGRPLPTDTRLWALPHNAQRTGYLPGMWHKRCNDRDGASRGARVVNARRRGRPMARRITSRAW